MPEERKLSTSDLAGRTKPDDARRRQDAPPNEPLEEDRSDQRRRLDDERKNAQPPSAVKADERSADSGSDGKATPLLEGDAANRLAQQWTEIQVDFVDRPRDAVSRADELVANVMQQLATRFADERNNLESQWSSGDGVDTEALRVALQRYRSFFHRLLNA